MLILARDSLIPFVNEVTIASITTRIRNIPSEVFLGPADGMPQECAINLDRLQTVLKRSLGRPVTHLSASRMREVRSALLYSLGFDE